MQIDRQRERVILLINPYFDRIHQASAVLRGLHGHPSQETCLYIRILIIDGAVSKRRYLSRLFQKSLQLFAVIRHPVHKLRRKKGQMIYTEWD